MNYLRRKPKPWTAQEIELALKLLDDKSADDRVIFRLLGRTRQACLDKMKRVRAEANPKTLRHHNITIHVPSDVLEDRNRRLMVERDLTAAQFGDPPRGWSALERRS